MPEQFTRATERFRVNGVDLNNPLDSLRPGYYPLLENVRSFTDGVLQPRQGLTSISTVITNQTPTHSVRRLNDPNSGNFQRIVGAGTKLAYGTTAFTTAQYSAVDLAFSGNPLTFLPFRPDQSIASWMYIADSTAMYKIIGNNPQSITVGTTHKLGVAPPATPPVVELARPNSGVPFNFQSTGSSPNNWTKDNIVLTAASSLTTRIPATQTTTAIRYDSGSTGWCSIVVNDTIAGVLGPGEAFAIDNGLAADEMIVYEIYPKSGTTSLTVGSILYDNAPTNTGACIIQPSQSIEQLIRNCVVQLNGGTNYFRVTDTIQGPDGTKSFRTNTGATTIAATNSLAVVNSFRTYDAAGHTVGGGDTIHDFGGLTAGATIQTSGAGTSSAKTGWIQLTPASITDISQNVTNALGATVSFSDNDYIHTAIQVSDISKVTQGRMLLDCDNTSYTVTNATNATPIVVTIGAHDLVAGDTVYITGVTGNTAANGTWTVSAPSGTAITLLDGATNSAGSGAYVNGGTAKPLFKKNFFYRAFSPSDLTAAAKGTQTAVDNRANIVQKRQIDGGFRHVTPGRFFRDGELIISDPTERGFTTDLTTDPGVPDITDPSRSQAITGDNQWSDLLFKYSDFSANRVGSDASRGFATINSIRFEFTFTDTTTQIIRINSVSILGGNELDTADLAIPYIYRYRYRVSTTGAVSNWSPASRSGVLPKRGQTTVTVVAPTGVPEVDKIDIQRIGGSNTTWLTIGTTPIGTTTFTDKTSDIASLGAAALSEGDTNYQPWPVLGKPASGTSAANGVVGPYIKDSGTTFNTSWAKGTPIRINGVDTTIRRVISTSLMEAEDSMGSQTSVSWEIPEPTLLAQPLPALWEWNGTGFACGDLNNPGYLYYTNGNSMDTTTDANYLEVTSPSEPLMNGVSFNGKNYVWSSERMFELEQIGPGSFLPLEIPGHHGLASRWGIAVGERLWFVSRDGIYQTGGGDAISITDETLRPLFVREGNVGVAVNGFNPPDFTVPTKIRLSYYDGYLYFVYQDTAGALRILTYTARAEKPGWWPDVYLDGRGITYLYGEEGSAVHSLLACGNDTTTGKLYQVTGTTDGASPITSHVRTQYFDAQDRRAEKRWGDFILDADPNAATLNLTLYQNNATSTTFALTPATMTGSGRTQQIIDLASGGDPTTDYSRNVALDITWTSALTPQLFLWEPAYTLRPETTDLRSTSWDTAGFEGDKFFQGIEIDADTGGVARTIQIEYDGASTNVGATLTVNHTNRQLIAYSFPAAFIAGTVRLRPTDGANTWKLYNYEWKFQPEPPLGLRWESQQTSFGVDEFLHMKAMYVTVRSTDVVTVTITRTDDSTTQSYTIASTANARKKVYLPLAVTKGKAFSFVFSSPTPFRLYKSDTVVLTKPWASEEQFSNRNVFGAEHGNGAVPI